MIWVVLLLAGQAATPICGGSDNARDCRLPNGGSYTERRLGERIVRRGTDVGGRGWTEFINPAPDGWTLAGSDDAGATWYQSCSRLAGIRGSNRNGKSVFVSPAGTHGCALSSPPEL